MNNFYSASTISAMNNLKQLGLRFRFLGGTVVVFLMMFLCFLKATTGSKGCGF